MISDVGVIILAAGLGTRMKSNKAKVLHEICGRPMINYVVDIAVEVAGSNVFVVVGHQADQVRKVVAERFQAQFVLQQEQLGTGHAVLCALPKLGNHIRTCVILCGDVPLIRSRTIKQLLEHHESFQRDVTLFAMAVDNPKGYGRVLFDHTNQLIGIVEEADADPAQKAMNVINTGMYVVDHGFLSLTLPQLKADNAQNEIYLTDIIAIGHQNKKNMGVVVGQDPDEIIGVNSPRELQRVEKIIQTRFSEKY